MSRLLREAGAGGLAPCAIVLTMAAFSAAVCSFILFGILRLLTPIPHAYTVAFSTLIWVACMVRTWKELARSRAKWPNTRTSTSLFHAFQLSSVGTCFVLAFISGHVDTPTLPWFVFCIEIVVALFFLNYVILGVGFRAPFPRSAYIGLMLTIASAFWSYSHLPRL